MSGQPEASTPDGLLPPDTSGASNADAEAAREAFAAFLGARVFCQATGEDEAPGVVALGRPGDGVVPVFTSLEELARFKAARGETADEVSWFATTGAGLLELIPDRHAVLIDPGTDHATLLHRPDPADGEGGT